MLSRYFKSYLPKALLHGLRLTRRRETWPRA
jgi:hypothetical protein